MSVVHLALLCDEVEQTKASDAALSAGGTTQMLPATSFNTF